jgi:hypothetical protein
MLGEKVSDAILERRLPPENLAPEMPANWQVAQR